MVLADPLGLLAENRSIKGYFRCLWFWDKTGGVQGCGECFEHSWPARLPRGHSLQNVQGGNGSVDPMFGCRVGSQGHPCQLGQSRSDWGNRGFQSGRHVWQSSQGRDIFVHHIHNIETSNHITVLLELSSFTFLSLIDFRSLWLRSKKGCGFWSKKFRIPRSKQFCTE